MRGGRTDTGEDVGTFKFETKKPLQPDDAADPVLMHCCAALAAVGNRALCPKELAELCMKRGWSCSGSQPFAIISSVIRAHLRRRQISTSNASNGLPPGPGLPPPLFVSYELTGPVAAEDVEAIGIIKAEKPAIKRGTLWYLSYHGTGFPSPFAPGRDPLGHLRNVAHAGVSPATSLAHTATPPSPDRMPTRRGPRHSFSFQPVYEDLRDHDAMGRGKRKRRASGIAGGDWESIALPSTSAAATGPFSSLAAAAPLSSRSLPRIAEDAAPRPVVTSPGPIVRLKLKLPAISDVAKSAPAPAVPVALIATHLETVAPPPSSDDETADEMEEDGWSRRKRLRYSPVKGSYRTPRPAFSASTSVFAGEDSASDEELEQVSKKHLEEALHRAADFDFEFDHAFSAPVVVDNLEELGHLAIDTVSPPAATPAFDESSPPVLKDALQSALESALKSAAVVVVDDDDEANDSSVSTESDEAVAAVLKGKERKRASSAGTLDAPPNIFETLCPERPAAHRARSHSYEGIPPLAKRATSEGPPELHLERRSPAPSLPALSVIESASTPFAVVALQPSPPIDEVEPPCQTPYGLPEHMAFDLHWREESDSHATSPSAIALSPPSLSEEGGDYYEGEGNSSRASRSVSPFHAPEEEMFEDAEDLLSDTLMMTMMELDQPEAAGLDILDREFGPDDVLPSIAAPSLEQAASFFTSFLGPASVPISVVGLRRDSISSGASIDTDESESEETQLPPARNTRSAARARQPAPPTPRLSPRKLRGGRKAETTSA